MAHQRKLDFKETLQLEKDSWHQEQINQALKSYVQSQGKDITNVEYVSFTDNPKAQSQGIDKVITLNDDTELTVDDKIHDTCIPTHKVYNCIFLEVSREYNDKTYTEDMSLDYGWATSPYHTNDILAVSTKEGVALIDQVRMCNIILNNWEAITRKYKYFSKQTYKYGKEHYISNTIKIPYLELLTSILQPCILWYTFSPNVLKSNVPTN